MKLIDVSSFTDHQPAARSARIEIAQRSDLALAPA
jgi:hypothetical protein